MPKKQWYVQAWAPTLIQSQLKRIEALKRRSAHFEREVTDLRTRLSRLRESLS